MQKSRSQNSAHNTARGYHEYTQQSFQPFIPAAGGHIRIVSPLDALLSLGMARIPDCMAVSDTSGSDDSRHPRPARAWDTLFLKKYVFEQFFLFFSSPSESLRCTVAVVFEISYKYKNNYY